METAFPKKALGLIQKKFEAGLQRGAYEPRPAPEQRKILGLSRTTP
jgi:hypothetical protein